jgi:glycosyltransferase involved in cell wall biosynthesis
MGRIVLAGAILQPGWTGGEPAIARSLGEGLTSRGHEVITWGFPRTGAAIAGLATSVLDWDVVSVGRYDRLLRRSNPDVVLGFYDYDTSLCRATRALGIPYVACAHIYWPVCPIGILYIDGSGPCTGSAFGKCVVHMSRDVPDSRLPMNLKRLPLPMAVGAYAKFAARPASLGRADAIVVPSQRMADILVRAGYHRIYVVPDAVSLPEIPFSEWGGGRKELFFPSASSSERKGLNDFVGAAKRVKSLRPATGFVATNFAGNEWVEGTPFISRAELLERLSRCYAVAAPALWEEPFGLTLTEAMAAGRPVVAYDSGAAREIVVDGVTGFVVPRGDVVALAGAMERLLADEGLALRMGRAGRERAIEKYSIPRMVQGYLEVIRVVSPRKWS